MKKEITIRSEVQQQKMIQLIFGHMTKMKNIFSYGIIKNRFGNNMKIMEEI